MRNCSSGVSSVGYVCLWLTGSALACCCVPCSGYFGAFVDLLMYEENELGRCITQ